MNWGKAPEKKKAPVEPSCTGRDVMAYNINEVSNETLESTRRMRTMCEESKDTGMATMSALQNQGESIERWEEVVDGINEDMALAEKALKAMDAACFGMIPRFWKRDKGFKLDDAVWAEPEIPKADCLPEAKVRKERGTKIEKIRFKDSKGSWRKALNPDHCFVAALGIQGEQDVREKEMEENMEEVSAIIGNLRNVANDINNTVKAQNETLDRIHKKADSDIQRVKVANEKAAALMK